MKQHTNAYYLTRATVRFVFWTAIVTGLGLAAEALGKLVTW